MTINLRQRKQGKNGKISLYLELYKGKSTSADGKIKYLRDYEYLNLFLVDTPRTESDRLHNKEILQLAKNIKNKRELEVQSGIYGFQTNNKNTNFYQYYNSLVEKKRNNSIYNDLVGMLHTFSEFAGQNITCREITANFCEKYLRYLQNKTSLRGKKLANSSVKHYFKMFSFVVKQAIKVQLITENPLLNIALPKVKKSEKIYLTLAELKLLVGTDCKQKVLKRAFIFSCLTGLRWSDVYKLKWSEIQEREGRFSLAYKQKKTSEVNYLPLSEQAVVYLGERKVGEKVFSLVKYSDSINRYLQEWCEDAGIFKKITYHSSRHTFAVLQLSLGTSIFVVQKLLGHSNIASTQVYANIVDSEKEKAMDRIPSIL